jgi:RimJ/RimL family protein N-acetyltransferase
MNYYESHDIILRKIEVTDKDKVCQWIISPAIIHYSFVVPGSYFTARDNIKSYADKYFNNIIYDISHSTYVICYDSITIGIVGLKNIKSHSADCFINIGEPAFRGRGFGYKSMIKLLDIAFYSQEFKDISLDVLEFNKVAIKIYHNLGFIPHNNHTWHYDEFGLYWRVIRMSIAKHKWLMRGNNYVE